MPSKIVEVVSHHNAFSGDIDHRSMTGGRLDVRKVVEILSESPHLYINRVIFPLGEEYGNVHQGLHTLEHALAYAGGLRDQLRQLMPGLSSAHIFDISPYRFDQALYGFRLLSAQSLPKDILTQAFSQSLKGATATLSSGKPIPFATAEQCGQYRFHDRQAALGIIGKSQAWFKVYQEEKLALPGQFVTVSDLRLLKPQVPPGEIGDQPQTFLTPGNSYTLAEAMETQVSDEWTQVNQGAVPVVRVGTYGCMTGHYVLASAEHNPLIEKAKESSLESQLHVAFTRVMNEVLLNDSTPAPIEVVKALQLIAEYSPHVFANARL